MSPTLVHTADELAAAIATARQTPANAVGFVPTMGALHGGHASLMDTARKCVGEDGVVVASIFVNPTQFGEGEDLDHYPRTLPADLEVCDERGVDIVFAPALTEIYPDGLPQLRIDPGPLADILEGAQRPGHFAGVCIVVAKLFNLVRPDFAVFGEKDYQQLAVLRQLGTDLSFPVEIVGAETERDAHGLALSSRNRFLSGSEQRSARYLNLALRAAQTDAQHGYERALGGARAILREAHGVDLDYLEVRATDLSLLPETITQPTDARILIAARVGTTRLIDNMPLTLGPTTEGDN